MQGRRGHAGDQHGPDAGGDEPERGERHGKQRDRCEGHDHRSPRRHGNAFGGLEEADDQNDRAEAQNDPRQRARDEAPGPISAAVPMLSEPVAPKATSAKARSGTARRRAP